MARRRWSFWMTPLEHRSLRKLDDWYRGLLTPAGRALFWATMACGLMLGASGQTRSDGVLLWAFSFCAGALLAAIAIGLFFRPRVTIERLLSPPVAAGNVLRYRVRVQNTGRRVARHIAIEERGLPAEVRPAGEAPVIDRLLPGEQVEVTLQLACLQRGAYDLQRLQGASIFPSGLVKIPRKAGGAERVLVYPKTTAMGAFALPRGRHYQPGGITQASSVGESPEFFGTRDWRDGDRLRDLHWPSVARTGRLVVKEFQEEYFTRLALVVDLEAHTAAEEQRMEEALSLAAGAAEAVARQDAILDVYAVGDTLVHLQAGRALAQLSGVLDVLASVDAADGCNIEALEAALLPDAERLSAAVLVLLRWDEKRARLLEALRSRGVAVRVVLVQPGALPQGLAEGELVPVS